MKTWGNINIGVALGDEIKRKVGDKEWIVTKIDYPSDGGVIINALSDDGSTMRERFDPTDWLKSGINYMNALMTFIGNKDTIEEEHLKFFKEDKKSE